jgi:large subunit ribosomal protein L30
MAKIRITQVKSGIDRNETAKRTLIALGLRKMNATVEVEATPQILGMVKRVGHLLKVEDVQGEEVQSNNVRSDVAEAPIVASPVISAEEPEAQIA